MVTLSRYSTSSGTLSTAMAFMALTLGTVPVWPGPYSIDTISPSFTPAAEAISLALRLASFTAAALAAFVAAEGSLTS